MNKFKLMLALLGASSMVLASCGGGEDPTPEVEKKITSVSVSCGKTLEVGKTVTAKANVVAEGGASKDVTWSSSDETVATVDSNGVVTGKKAGKVTITATSTFDSTKSGFVEIDVVSPDWSSGVKKAMQDTLGMVLPYFEGAFTWAEDEETGGLVAESSNAADTEKVIAAYDALQLPKSVEEDYVEYKLSTSSEDYAVIVDVYAEDEKAYVSANLVMIKWPAGKIAEALEGYTTLEPESVPAAEGTQFNFMLDEEYNFSCYVLVVGSLEAYTTKLLSEGWTIVQIDQEYGITILLSPKSSLVMQIMALDDESFMFNVYATGDPVEPILEWPAEQVAAYIGEHTEETIPAAEGTKFVVTEKTSGYNALLIDVTGSTAAAYLAKLEAANWVIEDYSETYGYYECYSPEGYLELAIFPMESGFEIQLLLTNPPAVEWPAEQVAAYIGEHTEETVPAAEGTSFSVSEKTSPYNALIIDITGDSAAYLAKLEAANWVIEDYSETYGYYECYSPEGYLELAIFPGEGNFEIQLILANPPAVEWPAADVAAFIGEHTEETVPAAEGTSFSVSEKTSPYNALIIDVTGDVAAYISTLQGANWQVDDLIASSGYYDCYSPEHYLELAIFPMSDGAFEIQLLLSEPPAPEFPAEALAEFIGDYTTDTVPSPEGTGFENGISSGVFWANVTGGDASAYMETLALAGYVSHDKIDLGSSVHVLTSESGALQLVLIESTGSFELDVYKVVAPQYDEYPADLVNAFTGAVTEEVLVAPEADGFDVVGEQEDFYGDTYYELVARYGDAYTYALNLYESGWVVDASNYEDYGLFLAQSPGKTLTLQIWDNGIEFFVDIYASEPAPAEFPADNVAAFIGEWSETVVPAAEGTAFVDVGTYYGDFYEVVVTGDMAAYEALLLSSGFTDNGPSYWGEYYLSADEKVELDVSEGYGGDFYIDIYLVEPLVPADFPSAAISTFLNGRTEETVPECFATKFDVTDYETYLKIKAENASVKDYVDVLENAGWSTDYVSGSTFVTADSPNGSITLELEDYSYYGDYINIYVYYNEPKLTEWPTDAVATALGDKAKTTLPGISGEGVEFDFTDNGNDSCIIDVYGGALPADYVKTLTDAGFEVTKGSAEDYYWYLLSADKTVKVVVMDYLADGEDYFEIRAFGQDPTWEATSFDASVIENFLGLESGAIPAIEDGGKFTYSQGESNIKVTVESSPNVTNYKAALTNAGFVETASGSGIYVKDGVVAAITVENPITGKYNVNFYKEAPAEKSLLELVQECMGTSENIPMPCDDANAFVKNGDKDCTINVSGGDATAYCSALEAAGFEKDTTMSMAGYYCYIKGDITIDVDATGGSNTNFKVYIY